MTEYYESLKKYTIESIPVKTPNGFSEKILEAYKLCAERDHELTYCVRLAEEIIRDYSELRQIVEEFSEKWGGVFVRTDTVAPLDSCNLFYKLYGEKLLRIGVLPLPETMACICWKPIGVITLLMSGRIAREWESLDVLWLRRPVRMNYEVRVFIYNGAPRLVSWKHYTVGAPLELPEIYENKYHRLIEEVTRLLGKEKYSLDLALTFPQAYEHKPVLVDVNPFPEDEGEETLFFQKDFWRSLRRAVREDKIIFKYPVEDKTIIQRELVVQRTRGDNNKK